MMSRTSICSRFEDSRPSRERPLVAEDNVGGYAEIEHQALLLAILGYEAKTGLDAVPRRLRRERLAVQQDLAAVEAVQPKYRSEQFGPPGSDEPGDADDLPATHLQADAVEPSRTQSGNPQHLFIG